MIQESTLRRVLQNCNGSAAGPYRQMGLSRPGGRYGGKHDHAARMASHHAATCTFAHVAAGRLLLVPPGPKPPRSTVLRQIRRVEARCTMIRSTSTRALDRMAVSMPQIAHTVVSELTPMQNSVAQNPAPTDETRMSASPARPGASCGGSARRGVSGGCAEHGEGGGAREVVPGRQNLDRGGRSRCRP